ncbi:MULTISPECIES: hypothetical protein [unclassified Mesorhizobium]|uniref:hypothetical protein n=1 Tax=unclassified Mesorhizobium TaxID=325217 RepID=UPI0015C6CE13|nr:MULTISPECIES: hypothetical protein [unclassified Mesorhizobium]MDG4902929.1 hypothetical protein [Mesorhizobium sp. WSM4962]MDG4906321.1 hypothetical protein [Mesorhizobium sp. WSM4898]MDG4920252.1 hypothetical protein [Mesorhizobium sp. WSM4989]
MTKHPSKIDAAARFLVATPFQARPKPLLPALRKTFGLSAAEAIEAIRQSHELRRAT